jgi:hypothetical protein
VSGTASDGCMLKGWSVHDDYNNFNSGCKQNFYYGYIVLGEEELRMFVRMLLCLPLSDLAT